MTVHLSPRQKQVVELIAKAYMNKEIAYELHISEGTVKVYLSAIYDKLHVGNRTELALWALRQQPAPTDYAI